MIQDKDNSKDTIDTGLVSEIRENWDGIKNTDVSSIVISDFTEDSILTYADIRKLQ